MIKIIAGKYGSRNIQTLQGDNTRPTSNKVRGAIFSKVGPYFDRGSSLDLFAGLVHLVLKHYQEVLVMLI